MKYKFTLLTLLISIPSITWAASNLLGTDPVYVISNADRSNTFESRISNYRLEWNQSAGKFDLLPGYKRRPITIEESMEPIPPKPQENEPIYYSDDFKI